jgi:hypothetical protein
MPKHRLFQRQRLPVHRFRLLVLALATQHSRQATHARQLHRPEASRLLTGEVEKLM